MKATIDYFEIESDITDYTATNYKESGLYFNKTINELLIVDLPSNLVWSLGIEMQGQPGIKALFDISSETTEEIEVKTKEGTVSEAFALKMLAIGKSDMGAKATEKLIEKL